MKIVTVVGARPQFVKAAMVSHKLSSRHEEILVHTGQHYDYNMSEQFFDELEIPKPAYNLGISGGTHGQMTGKMLIGIEEVLFRERPDCLLVYGDTNSTLSAALAASKIHIPICHVEAGTRTHSRTNPEEINRICTDHLASLLMVSTESGLCELKKEGLMDRAFFVGDPMYDAFLEYKDKLNIKDVRLTLLEGGVVKAPERYYYLTCHREENTSDECLSEIFRAMGSLSTQVVYPVHPRNKERALRVKNKLNINNIILTNPVGYLESICLLNNSSKVVTDSGGLQREAFFAGKQCTTILDFVVWPETMVGNRNQLSRVKSENILESLNNSQIIDNDYRPFGDGHSAEKIVSCLEKNL